MASGTSETRLGSPPSHPVDFVGFAPGSVLADRYRVIAMVGRGGMGEVYRADDLRLGQPVALKFLPAALEHDPVARDRLLAEVRNARTVSHPSWHSGGFATYLASSPRSRREHSMGSVGPTIQLESGLRG